MIATNSTAKYTRTLPREGADHRLEEIELALKNITRAIEAGAPLAMFSERREELMIENDKVLHLLQQASTTMAEESDIESISGAIVDFCSSFRWAFEHSPLHEQKELLRRSIWRIEVDGGERTAECYVRRFPIVAGLLERMIRELEKHATATDKGLPLCNVKVPGTGYTPD